MAFLCVDVGATNTLIGVGNGDFEVVEEIKSAEFLDDVDGCLREILDSSKKERTGRSTPRQI